MSKSVLLIFIFSLLMSACKPERSEKLTIAASANMQFAMEALTESFTRETEIECETIIGSSGKLTAQIMEGAPFDVFVSADLKYPTELFEQGLTTAAPKAYAYGRLVLWSATDDLTPTINLLTQEKIRHIALANPKTAPYGVAAMEVLEHYDILEKVENKLVYGESIAQTNQFIVSKAAELGFTAKAVVLSSKTGNQGQWLEVDPSLYTPISQGIVILKNQHLDQAQAFYDFLFSTPGKEILDKFGYSISN